MPKVSVIVPVYNVEKYVGKCLDSLINQTLQDIEIIVVNDGSTDNSEKIINEYLTKYGDRIKYFTKPNGGLSDARNYGMQFASGEYIAFLDSDDYADETTYEKMYNKAIQDDCDFVECDFIWRYEDRDVLDNGIIYESKKEMLAYARVVAWNKLIKRNLIYENELQFPKGLRYEDVEFFYKLIPHINKVGFVKENLIYYIQRDSSIANTQNEKDGDIFLIYDNVIDYYKKHGYYNEYKVGLEYSCTRLLLCSSFLRIVKIDDRKIRKQLIRSTISFLQSRFPNWRRNEILLKEKGKKSTYMRSVNIITLKVYAFAFRLLKR